MKKESLLKSLVVIVLSIVLILSFTSLVSAADDSFPWDSNTATAVTTTGAENTSNSGNTNSTNGTDFTTPGIVTTTPSTNTTNTTNNTSSGTMNVSLNTNTQNTNSNVNALAYTGLESNSPLAIVIVLGAIVAAYSFKKVRDYNSL